MPLFKICAREPSSLPKLFIALVPVFQRTTAQMVFHIFAKEAGVGKTQTMAYLLHTKVGCAQIIGDGRQGVLLYPRIGCAPRVLFANTSALAQVELSAEQAADAYKRMKLLHDNGALPEIKWVEVQTRYQQAKDAVRLAKATVQAAKAQKNISQKNLSDTRLYAPSAGFLSKKITEVGQNVAPGQPVATLVDIQQVKVKINVAEDDRAKIHVGQTFRFTVSSLPGKTFVAYVTEIGVAADPITRSYEVKAVADNARHQLLPGMVCDVNVQATAPSSAIMLPANIIQIDFDNRPFVWTVVKGMAHKTYVIIGQSAGDYVQITTGLSTKDIVIVEGQQKVSNGMRVE